jgi:hypothetical protein
MINGDRALKEKLYFVSDNGVMRTIPYKDGQGFVSCLRIEDGDFTLKSERGMLNEEIAIAFTNSLTIEISEEDYNNKTEEELHDLYMKRSLNN